MRTYFYKKHICGIAALLLAICLTVCGVTEYYASCVQVRDGVLRLHIIANSDSASDQQVKLKVRDALLTNGFEIFDGSVTSADAKQKIEPQLGILKSTANEVLKENGFNYNCTTAELVYEYFDTRSYEDTTLPAGYYTALRITLGKGEGKNWWCVMFPPLCLPACTSQQSSSTDSLGNDINSGDAFAVFSQNGNKVVHAEGGYKVKFKIVELIEKLIEEIKD